MQKQMMIIIINNKLILTNNNNKITTRTITIHPLTMSMRLHRFNLPIESNNGINSVPYWNNHVWNNQRNIYIMIISVLTITISTTIIIQIIKNVNYYQMISIAQMKRLLHSAWALHLISFTILSTNKCSYKKHCMLRIIIKAKGNQLRHYAKQRVPRIL